MKATTLVAGLVLAMARIAIADTAVGWIDCGKNAKPSFVSGYLHSSGWEAWSFAQLTFPIYEVGKLKVVDKTANTLTLGGAYLSHWVKTDQNYIEPFVLGFGNLFNDWSYKVKLGAYAPLNGGPWAVFSDEVSVVRKLDQKGRVQLGVGGKFYDEEGAQGFVMAGPIARLKFDETAITLRYSPIGNRPNQARVE